MAHLRNLENMLVMANVLNPKNLIKLFVVGGDKEESESLFDWNPVMRDVLWHKSGKDVNATVVKDLLVKYYKELPEDKV